MALEELGYDKCHHMMEVYTSSQQGPYWSDISKGDNPRWDEVFAGYQATTDFPACIFYRELAQHYPEAKVVLTVRDEDAWYKSVIETIWALGEAMPKWLLVLLPPLRLRFEMVDRLVWGRVFDHRVEDPVNTKRVFRQHNQQVQNHIPAERLLVYQVSEGWGPLCEFLGCEVPNTPFPRSNDTATMKKRLAMVRLVAKVPLLLALVGAAIGLTYLL